MRLADFLEQNIDAVLENAIAFAKTQASAIDLDELQDHLPQVLQTIVRDLRTPQSSEAQRRKSEGLAISDDGVPTAASEHGRSRALSGFNINEMVAEYRALRASVLRLWAADKALVTQSIEDLVRFNEAIDQAVSESVA
jgi:hypothetical protein